MFPLQKQVLEKAEPQKDGLASGGLTGREPRRPALPLHPRLRLWEGDIRAGEAHGAPLTRLSLSRDKGTEGSPGVQDKRTRPSASISSGVDVRRSLHFHQLTLCWLISVTVTSSHLGNPQTAGPRTGHLFW